MPVKFIQYGDYIQFTSWEKENEKKETRRGYSRLRSTKFGLPFHFARRSDSLRRTRTVLMRRVLSAIEELGSPLLFTFTFSDEKSKGAHNVAISGREVSRFLRKLRSIYPKFEAVVVPELSPRFRIHYHGLFFGLPETIGDMRTNRRTTSIGTERSTRILAKAFHVGFLDVRRTDGNEKLAYYLTKYLSKSHAEPLFLQSRLLRFTANFPKPYGSKGKFAEYIKDIYNEKRPLYEFIHHSPFLGKLEIKKYKIS